jgi:hypothetical protein
MEIIAFIEQPAAIRKIFQHLKLWDRPQRPARRRRGSSSLPIPVYHLLEASWQHPTKNRQSHPDLWFEHLNFRLKLSIPALRSELKQLLKGNGRIPKKRLPAMLLCQVFSQKSD